MVSKALLVCLVLVVMQLVKAAPSENDSCAVVCRPFCEAAHLCYGKFDLIMNRMFLTLGTNVKTLMF